MNGQFKKLVAIVLIVSMVLGNNGIIMFAESIDEVVATNEANEKETPNYYYEYEYEQETIIEETMVEETSIEDFEKYLEEANPDVFDSEDELGEEALEEKTEEEPEQDEEVVMDEDSKNENEFVNNEEEFSEKENPLNEENSYDDENAKEEKNSTDITENVTDAKENNVDINISEKEKEETKETKETSEVEEKNNDASESEIEKENEIKEESEENQEEVIDKASESEVNDETKNEEKEKASLSEVENKVFDNEISTESNLDKNEEEKIEIASESEIESVASESEIEKIASESEIVEATESEIEKEKIVATVSKVSWKIKKILIASYTNAYVFDDETEAERKARLATCAEVVIVNNLGEEKTLQINLNWKLVKKVEVNANTKRGEKITPASELRKKFKVDEIVSSEMKKEIVIASDNEALLVEKVKNENEKLDDKEIIIVSEAKENTDEKMEDVDKEEVVENKNTKENNTVNESVTNATNDIENETAFETIIAEIESQTETETETAIEVQKETQIENIIETVKEIVEETIEEIIEPTVADFAGTENIASDSSVDEVINEKDIDDNNDIDSDVSDVDKKEVIENNSITENTNATEFVDATESEASIDVKNETAGNSDVATESEIASNSEVIKSGVIEKGLISDEDVKYCDLKNVYIYKADTEALGNAIIEAINNVNAAEKIEEELAEENAVEKTNEKKEVEKDKNDDGGIFGSILKFFGFGNATKNENNNVTKNNNVTETTEEEEAKTPTEELLDMLKNAKIDCVEKTEVDSMIVEQEGMLFGEGATHIDHTIKNIISNDTKAWFTGTPIVGEFNPSLNTYDAIPDAWLKSFASGSEADVSGYRFLRDDITISIPWNVKSSFLTLCTNGHSITFATAGCIKGVGRVNICNCTNYVSKFTTTGPQYGWTDRFFATTNETYVKYHETPLVGAEEVGIYAGDNGITVGKNIEFSGSRNKNQYVGHIAVRQMEDAYEEDDPEVSGGGSLVFAKKKLDIYNVSFKNNIATRTNGVALNAQLGVMRVENSEFINNRNLTNRGGAIAFNPRATKIYNCNFEENYANTNGGALYGREYSTDDAGKDIYINCGGDGITNEGTWIEKTTFKNNRALANGGAIFLDAIKNVNIGSTGDNGKVTFESNVAGNGGGALAVKHMKADDGTNGTRDYEVQVASNTTLRLNVTNTEFKNNQARRQRQIRTAVETDVNNGKIVDLFEDTDPVGGDRSTYENQGGAVYIGGVYKKLTSAGGTLDILKEANFNNCTFTENRAVGATLEVKKYASGAPTGEVLATYEMNNYGGAIYARDVKLNFNGTTLSKNYSMTGANLCVYNSDVNIVGGTIEKGTAYNDKDIIENDEEIKKYEKKIITPGGGAIYIMKNSKVNIDENATIEKNINAFYLDNGNITLGRKNSANKIPTIENNVGEYLIGYTNYNYGEDANGVVNSIYFNGVDIRNQKFYGYHKDYSIPTTYTSGGSSITDKHHGKTQVHFNNVNAILNNKIEFNRKEVWDADFAEASNSTCNILVRSSISNVEIRCEKDMERNENFDKIGLYYDFNPDTNEDMSVYLNYTPANVPMMDNGGIWTNYFSVDGSENDGWCEGWKFYIKEDEIKISPNIVLIKFDSYIEGIPRIAPQYYNFRRNKGHGIIDAHISTPTEILRRDMNTNGLTLVGFMQRDCTGYYGQATTSYVLWDYDHCKLRLFGTEEEVTFVGVYTDDTMNVKACGCPNGVPCNHENGVQHSNLRGNGVTHTDSAKEQNYIIVATPVHLAYIKSEGGNQYKTQFSLSKDITLTAKEAKDYLRGEMVINLNGHTIYYDTSSDSNVHIFDASLGEKNKHTEQDASIFIVGKATTNEAAPRGKIVGIGKHKGSFIEAGGKGVFLSNVDLVNIEKMSDDAKGLITNNSATEKDNNQYVTLENVTFDNVDLNEELVSGVSKVHLKNVKTKTKVKLNKKPLVTLAKKSADSNCEFKIVDSEITLFEDVKTLVSVTGTGLNKTEVVIGTSSIVNNKFNDSMIDVKKASFGNNSKVSLLGINNIKENEVTEGKYLIGGDATYIYGDDNTINTITDNTVPSGDDNSIVRISSNSDAVEFRGLFKLSNNKEKETTLKSSAIYQEKSSKVKFGQAGIYVSGNNTKYNWFMDNKFTEAAFTQISSTTFRASDSKIEVRLKDRSFDQVLYKDWKVANLYNENTAENTFVRDVSYDEVSNEKINSYKKANAIGSSDVYLGTEYITGTYRLYYYDSVPGDERKTKDYNHTISDNSIQRIALDEQVILDNPKLTSDVDETKIMWEGLAFIDDSGAIVDTSKECVYERNVRNVPAKATRNFVITGYKYNDAHVHDSKVYWIEARNEGHLQASSSYAYLHNDIELTHEMLNKLHGDYRICLNGYKLTLAEDVNFINTAYDCNIEIHDHDTSFAGLLQLKSDYTKDFIKAKHGRVYLHDVKVEAADMDKEIKGRLLKAENGTNVEFNNVYLSNSKLNYTSFATDKSFVEIDSTVPATLNNITMTGVSIDGNRENNNVIYVGGTSTRDIEIANLGFASNNATATASLLKLDGFRNVKLTNPVIRNNILISGTSLDMVGTGTLTLENAEFNENLKTYIEGRNDYGENTANIGIKGFASFDMIGGKMIKDYINITDGKIITKPITSTLYVKNIKTTIKGVTFDENIRRNVADIYGFTVAGDKDFTFEDCTFTNAIAGKSEYIKIMPGFTGNMIFKGNNTFENMQVRTLIDEESNTATVTLDGTKISGITANYVINVSGNATLLASGSTIENINGNGMLVTGDNVTLYNTEIKTGTKVGAVAIDLDKHKIKVGEKIVVKGFTTNVKMASQSKIIAETTHKIKEGSEIGITVSNDEFNFFDTWSADYIEKYDTHTATRWKYFPEDVFKLDAAMTGRYIYKSGTNASGTVKLYVGKQTPVKYATLEFWDYEVHPSTVAPIAVQRVELNKETLVDKVWVNYLSTSSQVWLAYLYPENPEKKDQWRVFEDHKVTLTTEGVYKVLLTKKHIHKICGVDASVECKQHIDGIVHTDEIDFYTVSSDSELKKLAEKFPSAEVEHLYFGLLNDINISQDTANELKTKAEANNADIKICIQGFVLTFDQGVTLECSKGITLMNCLEEGYVTASDSNATSTLVKANGELTMYGLKFANFTTNKPVVEVGNASTKMLFENVEFNNITNNNNSLGLLNITNNNVFMGNLVFDNNTASGSDALYNIANTLNGTTAVSGGTTNITTISMINNKYHSKLLAVNANTSLPMIDIRNNTLVNSSTSNAYGAIYANASLTFTKDMIIKDNDASVRDDAKGGALYIAGGKTVSFNKNLTSESNKAGVGGAIYMENGSSLNVTEMAYLKTNEAINGSAIYNDQGSINAGKLIFDGNVNRPDKDGSVGHGVYAWSGNFTYDNIVFKNHGTGAKELLYNLRDTGTDKLVLTNPLFKNNVTGADAICLRNIAAGSKITGITKDSKDNSFNNFVNVIGGNFEELTDIEINDNYFEAAAIKFSTTSNVPKLSSISITGNRTVDGALNVKGNHIDIADVVKITNNMALLGNVKDVYIAGENAYINPVGNISTKSRLTFSAYKDGVLVFKNWDSSHIAGFDTAQGEDALYGQHAYTPENSYQLGISDDATSKGYDLYKVGETTQDVYIGSTDKYVKITFYSDNEVPGKTYATQNIEKGVNTRLDKVDTTECAIERQTWVASRNEAGEIVETWEFKNYPTNPRKALYSEDKIIYYIKPHLHKLCGCNILLPCSHEAIPCDSSADYEYKMVRNQAEIEGLDTTQYHYVYLLNDITITGEFNIPTGVDGLRGICLNGYKILKQGDNHSLIKWTPTNAGDKFGICDCKGIGEINVTGEKAQNTALFELNVTGNVGHMGIYNVTLASLSLAAPIFKNVTAGSYIYTENISIKGLKDIPAIGIIENGATGNVHMASLSIINNTINEHSIINAKKNMSFGNIYLFGNTSNEDLIKTENETSSPILIKGIYANANKVTNGSILRATNSIINISEKVSFTGNKTTNAVFNLRNNARMKVNDTAVFIGNENTVGDGGAINMDASRFELATVSVFSGNKAKNGAAIYARNVDGLSSVNYLKIDDAVLLGNEVNAGGHGVINYSGVFEPTNISFMNHTVNASELIYAGDDTTYNTIKLDKITLADNVLSNGTTNYDAIYIKKATESSLTSFNNEAIKNNKFNNLLNLDTGDMKLADININGSGNVFTDTVFNIKNANNVSIYNDFDIENVNVTNGALRLENSKVTLGDTLSTKKTKVVVKGNGSGKNIIFADTNSYFKGAELSIATDDLSSASEIYVKVAEKGAKVLEGWNEKNIDMWGKLDYSVDPYKYMYTPENSNMFYIENDGYTVYKKGTESVISHVSVHAGKENEDFVKLTFYYLEEDETEPLINETQNVAKGEETTVDVVDSFEYEPKYQQWFAPREGVTPVVNDIWELYVDDGSAMGKAKGAVSTYNGATTIIYKPRHFHKNCGIKLKYDCEHEDTTINHTETHLFWEISSISELYNPAAEVYPYVNTSEDLYLSLKEDIQIENISGIAANGNAFNFPSNLKGICLNGHRLLVRSVNWEHGKDSTTYINQALYDIGNKKFEICDCKTNKEEHGAISSVYKDPAKVNDNLGRITYEYSLEAGGTETHNGIDWTENNVFRLTNAASELYMYNLHFEDMKLIKKIFKGAGMTAQENADAFLVKADQGKAYIERPIFNGFTETGENGLFSAGGSANVKIIDPIFTQNKVLAKTTMLALTNNIEVSTLSIIDNLQSGDSIVKIKGNDVSVAKLLISGNKTFANGIITIEDGAKLTLTEDNEFIGNAVGGNGGVMVIKGELASNKGLLFKENTAGYGGALYIIDNGKVSATGETRFINNDAIYGAAIYGENIKEDSINITNPYFENNLVRENQLGGTIEWCGTLKLNNPIFVNTIKEKQTGEGIGIIRYYGGSLITDAVTGGVDPLVRTTNDNKLIVINPTFKNNVTEKSAINVQNLMDGSKIVGLVGENVQDNNFTSLINVDGGYLTIEGEIEGDTYTDAAIHIKKTVGTVEGITLGTSSIMFNTTTNGAVFNDGTKLLVKGAPVVRDNVDNEGNSKNIYIPDANSYVKGAGRIYDAARLQVNALDGMKVFEGWNATNFEEYDNPKKSVPPTKYMFTPEGSGIFVPGVEGQSFYKKGTSAVDRENVYIGRKDVDYITLGFWNRIENPNIYYGSQNIAAGINTKLDLIDSFEYEMKYQDWLLPHDYIKPKNGGTVWTFSTESTADPNHIVSANYNVSDERSGEGADKYVEIQYNQKHIHKECGLKLLYDCTHLGVPSHTSTNWYEEEVNSQEQIQNTTEPYVVLTSDIEVTGSLSIPPTLKGICLNGYTIHALQGTGALINVSSSLDPTFHITDCGSIKEGGTDGSITIKPGYTRTGDIIKVNSGAVKLYNLTFKDMNSVVNVVNVGAGATAYTQNMKIQNLSGAGPNGVLVNNGNLTLDNLIINDNHVTGDSPIVKLNSSMTIGTLSVTNNTTVNASVVQFDGNVSLKSMDVDSNTSEGNGTLYIPAGSTITVNNNVMFFGNTAKNGGALYIAGTLDLQKGALFMNNTATEKGGSVYIKEGGKFITHLPTANYDSLTFNSSSAKQGSSIYAEKLTYTSDTNRDLIVDQAYFSGDNATEGAALEWGGALKIASVAFAYAEPTSKHALKNINNNGTDKFEIYDSDFDDNNCASDIISLNNISGFTAAGAKLNNIKVYKFNDGNKAENLLTVNGGKAGIINSSFSDNAYTNAGINIVNNAEVVINNATFTNNTGTTYGAILVDGSKVESIGTLDMTLNKTTGSYGAAITLLNGATFDITGNKTIITNNTSVNGGAVYVDGKLGLENEVVINSNKTSVNNGRAKNIYIANNSAYTYGLGEIKETSKLSYTGANNCTVFKGWNATNFDKYDNPTGFTYTPENSGIFVMDAEPTANKYEFYKSGFGSDAVVKLGNNFAKLTFATADKKNKYGTQNVEKNVKTHIDKVYLTGTEKWVPTTEDSDTESKWDFSAGSEVAGKFSKSYYVYKLFNYNIIYTAGSRADETYVNTLPRNIEYGKEVSAISNPYSVPNTNFKYWKLRTFVEDVPLSYVEAARVKNICLKENGTAYLDAIWEGEFTVSFVPNAESIGADIENDGRGNFIGREGTIVTLNNPYVSSVKIGKKIYYVGGFNTKANGTGTNYSLGQSVGNIRGDLVLYLMWTTKNPNPPKPDPHGSGGGGGGGGSGVRSSGILDPNAINEFGPGMFLDDPNKPVQPIGPVPAGVFIVDEYGNIKDPNGNIVGNVYLGDTVNVDGSFTDKNGITHLTDGRVKDTLGNTYNNDGSITLANGLTYYTDGSIKDLLGDIYHVDGSITYADGSVKDVYGLIHFTDGSILTNEGVRYYTDGTVLYPDGTRALLDGTLIKPEEVPLEVPIINNNFYTPGNWEYDPKTNDWKFVNVNIDGSKTTYSERWITTKNSKGEDTYYIVDKNGSMITGWVKKDGEYYYMSENGTNKGELLKGSVAINGVTYNFDAVTGQLTGNKPPVKNLTVIGATNHISGEDGNWSTDPKTGKRVYMVDFKLDDGTVLKIPPSGWYMIDGTYYYFDKDGIPLTGLIISDGKYYYMNQDGSMLEGGDKTIDGVTYTFDKATGACRSSRVDLANI